MTGAVLTEADITVLKINNVLWRSYEIGWRYRFKRRPTCALYYILSGSLTVTLPEGELCLSAGDVGIFDAEVAMELENRGTAPVESYQLSFYADRNPTSLGLPSAVYGAADLRPRFASAYEGYSSHGIGYQIRTRAALLDLIAVLIAKAAEGKQGRAGARLTAVLSYIGKHYAEPLSLPLLSRAVGYSPSYLRELFRAELGTSPIHYINHLRIERACALLREDIPIWQAAELVGCPNANYFSRLFRAEMGITPGEYKGKCL